MSRFFNIAFKIFIVLYAIITFVLAYFLLRVDQGNPNITFSEVYHRTEVSANYYSYGPNWLRQNKYGLWEMYLQGSGFERGLAHGRLCKELNDYQEEAFVDKIFQLIPSELHLQALRIGIAWFNRDIENYIPTEFKNEIYGISLSANSKYNFIGPAYRRILNYHGAHDIGHALKNLALVGCTSFAVNQNTDDSSLLLGRNFDFFISDKFVENKIICHQVPDSGYAFTYITWASFIGVVSGMNDAGLTVTINAAKSNYPSKSAMPISLLAREILQYASTIDEACEIAKKRELFISESIHIASSKDNTSAIIEKTPTEIDIFRTENNSLVCANHFQSANLGNTEINKKDMTESPSVNRQERCEELIKNYSQIDYLKVAAILRDTKGKNDKNIGYCNEKAMNQMISHHSVIFKPHQQQLWISTSSYQLGEYLAYSTKDFKAFSKKNSSLLIEENTIPKSNILKIDFDKILIFKHAKAQIQTALFNGNSLPNIDKLAQQMIDNNSNYYYYQKRCILRCVPDIWKVRASVSAFALVITPISNCRKFFGAYY